MPPRQRPPDPKGVVQLTLDEALKLPPAPPAPKGAPDHGVHRPLPKKRHSATFEVTVGGMKLFVTTSEYEDGTLGEIFIDVAKEGSAMRGLLNSFAILFSKALQHGTRLRELVETFLHTKFPPSGIVRGHPKIKHATSIPDFIAQLLAIEYLGWKEAPKRRELYLDED
jgi:ribonucleoside-diphosphate reductase alpha chain